MEQTIEDYPEPRFCGYVGMPSIVFKDICKLHKGHFFSRCLFGWIFFVKERLA